MSLRVTGYHDGHRITEDLGPGRARVAGYGGSLITHPVTSVRPRVRLPRQPLKLARSKPMCGAVLPRLQKTCVRTAGHREAHRSAYAVEADNARRRRIYYEGPA